MSFTRFPALALLALLLCLLLLPAAVWAAPAYGGVQDVTDGSGGTVQIVLHGDEFFSYLTDVSGRVVVRDAAGVLRRVVRESSGAYGLGEPLSELTVTPPLRYGAPGAQSSESEPTDPTEVTWPDPERLDALRSKIYRSGQSAPLRMSGGGDGNGGGFSPFPSGEYDYANDPLSGKVQALDTWDMPPSPKRGSSIPLLVLLVEFGDPQNDTSSKLAPKTIFSDEQWHNTVFGRRGKSVSSYFLENSNGKFTYVPATENVGTPNDGVARVNLPIDCPLYVEVLDGSQNFEAGPRAGIYHGYDGKEYGIFNHSCFFAYAMSAIDDQIDLSVYDKNGDGLIAPTELAFLVVQAGFDAAAFSAMQDQPGVWSSSWVLNNTLRMGDEEVGNACYLNLDGVSLCKYVIVGENQTRGYEYGGDNSGLTLSSPDIGGPCHELGHDLGLMDLYDTTYSNLQYNVGPLSLMAGGTWGFSVLGDTAGTSPAHLDPYSKLFLGFYSEEEVREPGDFQLHHAADSRNYNILFVPTDDPEVYYLVENRTTAGFDEGLRCEYYYGDPQWLGSLDGGGAVYWRIDERVLKERWESNTINTVEGEYGIMPLFITYQDEDGRWHETPFRNTQTALLEPFASFTYERFNQLRCADPTGPITTVSVNLLLGEWTVNATGHWRFLAGGTTEGYAPHQFGSPGDPDCDVCGYTRAVAPGPGADSGDPHEPDPYIEARDAFWQELGEKVAAAVEARRLEIILAAQRGDFSGAKTPVPTPSNDPNDRVRPGMILSQKDVERIYADPNHIRVDAKNFEDFPWTIIELLRGAPGLTLELTRDEGESILISSDALPPYQENRLMYRLEDLAPKEGTGESAAE